MAPASRIAPYARHAVFTAAFAVYGLPPIRSTSNPTVR